MGSPSNADQARDGTEQHQPAADDTSSSPGPTLPAAPDPSADKGAIPTAQAPTADDNRIPDEIDIFTLSPILALRLLCRSIDRLVKFTGDVPPTPPVRSRRSSPVRDPHNRGGISTPSLFSPPVDTPIGSPEAHFSEPVSTIIGYGAEPIYIQHGAIARKFYSKRPPPISTEDYLLRMHRYCPMSTAVYLATSTYITNLAIVEKVVPVTPRNVHRLLLAGLRVAMKALEDMNWPHERFSKVGGVSEAELGRLEITFCFLMDFELKVDAERLQREADSLRSNAVDQDSASMTIALPSPRRDKRKASTVLPERPAVVSREVEPT